MRENDPGFGIGAGSEYEYSEIPDHEIFKKLMAELEAKDSSLFLVLNEALGRGGDKYKVFEDCLNREGENWLHLRGLIKNTEAQQKLGTILAHWDTTKNGNTLKIEDDHKAEIRTLIKTL